MDSLLENEKNNLTFKTIINSSMKRSSLSKSSSLVFIDKNNTTLIVVKPIKNRKLKY
jgi:hypothetical protein